MRLIPFNYALVLIPIIMITVSLVSSTFSIPNVSQPFQNKISATPTTDNGHNNPIYFEPSSNPDSYYMLRTSFGSVSFGVSTIYFNYYGSPIILYFPGSTLTKPVAINRVDFTRSIMSHNKITVSNEFYQGILYSNIYPGISLRYNIQSGQLKYEFEVKPNADYRKISLQYYTDAINVDQSSITIKSGNQILHDNNLVVFYKESNEHIVSEYKYNKASNVINYQLGYFDPSQTIIIDPIYESFSSYYGGIGADQAIRLQFASYSDIVVAGRSDHANFTDLKQYTEPNQDSYVTIFAEKLSFIRANFLIQGNGVDWVYDMIIGPNDKIYVLLYTTSTDLVVTNDLSSNGNHEGILLIRLSSTGNFEASTLIDRNGVDLPSSLHIDQISRIVIAGATNSTNWNNPYNILGKTLGDMNGVLLILTPGMDSIQHVMLVGGANYDSISDFQLNSEGDYFVLLESYSHEINGTTNFFVSSVDQLDSSQDLHLIKISSHLDFEYDFKFGGSSVDFGTSLVLDQKENIIIGGYTLSPDFPILNSWQKSFGSSRDDIYFSSDAFVIKVYASGDRTFFSSLIGGKYFDRIFSVTVDTNNYIDFVGNTESPDLPTIEGIQRQVGTPLKCIPEEYKSRNVEYPCEDILIGQFSQVGNITVLSYYGSPDKFDTAVDIQVSTGNNLYIVGWTDSNQFPIVDGISATYNGGSSDGIIIKFDYVFLAQNDKPRWNNPVEQFWQFMDQIQGYLPSIDFTSIFVILAIALSIRKIWHVLYDKSHNVNTEDYPTKTSENRPLRVKSTNIQK